MRIRPQTRKVHPLRDVNFLERSRDPLVLEPPQELLGIPDVQLSELYSAAMEYLSQEDFNNAIRSFRLLCQIQPYAPDFWFGLGQALHGSRLFEEAMSAFLMAETFDPHRFDCYEMGIRCAISMGNRKEGEHIFSRLLAHRRSVEDFSMHGSTVNELKALVRHQRSEKARSA